MASVVRLPGLVDVHVHLREPGGEHKETWQTGTGAALAGGITTVLAMPNTNPSIVDQESLSLVLDIAAKNSRCDFGVYVGANHVNSSPLALLVREEKEKELWGAGVCAMKMYLNDTFSTLKMGDMSSWMKHFESWPKSIPVVCHAEGQTMAAVLSLAHLYNRHVHIAHISLASEIELIKRAKEKGINVTCEVCPHHLFLCRDDFIKKEEEGEEYGSLGKMEVRPRLASKEDQEALWKNIDIIDIIATDHAPHTVEEKNRKEPPPPPGFPGLETVVPLMLTAVVDGRLSLEQLVEKMHTNPIRIFSLPSQSKEETYVEVEMGEEWKLPDAMAESKSRWTPFAGMTVKGRIKKVVLRGQVAFENGKVVAPPGFGLNIRSKEHGKRAEEHIPLSQEEKERARKERGEMQRNKAQKSQNLLSNLISVKELSKEILERLFCVADDLRLLVRRLGYVDMLRGKVLASLFFEPSTRTSCSFQVAMQRLGGSVVSVNEGTSSVRKGESLTDTVKTLASYADIIVIRHPAPGSAAEAAGAVEMPVINAGDGTGEHPTQALLDAYTILHELGTLHELHVVLVGDLKHGRTVHSLVQLLAFYGVKITLVSPPSLSLPSNLIEFLREKGLSITETTNLESVIPEADVLYMTRIQRERFESEEAYDAVKDSFVITHQLMIKAKKKMVVMHPLPRLNEIHKDFDSDPRAAYFRQMEAGMYVRMALLAILLGKA